MPSMNYKVFIFSSVSGTTEACVTSSLSTCDYCDLQPCSDCHVSHTSCRDQCTSALCDNCTCALQDDIGKSAVTILHTESIASAGFHTLLIFQAIRSIFSPLHMSPLYHIQ